MAMLAALPPAYFAMVMSTGIVSIACHHLGLAVLARPLLWLNLALYLGLWLLTLLRLLLYPGEIRRDLKSPTRGMGFFTLVAATDILGSQLILLLDAGGWAGACLLLGLWLWLLFMYTVLAALIIRLDKPPLAAGLNGSGWWRR